MSNNSDIPNFGCMGWCLILAIGGGLVLSLIEWREHDVPYNFIAAFYYYLLIFPLKPIAIIWNEVAITSYPNLNAIFAGFLVLLYVFVALPLAVSSAFRAFQFARLEKYIVPIFFTPALFSIFWFVFAGIFSWLFAK